MITKHTPGPWYVMPIEKTDVTWVLARGEDSFRGENGDPEQAPLAELDSRKAATPANARLIAAAPELLQVVSMLLDAIEDARSYAPVYPDSLLADFARAAAAKAVDGE